MLQPCIDQKIFEIRVKEGKKEMLVVGLLHCFNNKFLGPGIFRASTLEHPIVNVAGGIIYVLYFVEILLI